MIHTAADIIILFTQQQHNEIQNVFSESDFMMIRVPILCEPVSLHVSEYVIGQNRYLMVILSLLAIKCPLKKCVTTQSSGLYISN